MPNGSTPRKPGSDSAASRPPVPGVPMLVAAAVLFGLMAVTVKAATTRLPGAEVALVRFVIGLAACAIAALRMQFRIENRVGLAMRGAFGGAAVLLYFLAIAHLPVALAVLLNCTAPVFTAFFASVFLRERFGARGVFALGIATAGIACVLRARAPAGSIGFGLWESVGLGSAVLAGAAVATIRELRRTDGSWEIFASFCGFGAVLTLGPAARQWVTPQGREWLALLAVGVLAIMAQLLMTYALRYVPATIAGILAQLTPISAMVLGWALLGERITGLSALGAAVTLAGVGWGARLTARVPHTRQH